MASAGMPDAEASARMRRTARRAALWALRDPTASTVGKIASGMPGTALRAGRPNLSLSGGSRRRAPAVHAYAYRRLAGRAAGSNCRMRLVPAGPCPGKSPGRGPDELVGPDAGCAEGGQKGGGGEVGMTAVEDRSGGPYGDAGARGQGGLRPPGGATRARAPRMSGLNRRSAAGGSGGRRLCGRRRAAAAHRGPRRGDRAFVGLQWGRGDRRGSACALGCMKTEMRAPDFCCLLYELYDTRPPPQPCQDRATSAQRAGARAAGTLPQPCRRSPPPDPAVPASPPPTQPGKAPALRRAEVRPGAPGPKIMRRTALCS